MDGIYSSGEDLILKARKPYTITKQREPWTEEEHNRFLEALKLYGRAWQRIEEHIGTKTAVQIRSHAQKFFAKLEKEAHVKGVPVGQALDIEIPPPRPKRKPTIPYPRKLGFGHPMSQLGSKNGKSGTSVPSVPLTEDTLDLEKEPLAERPSDENFESETENREEDASCRSCVLPIHPGSLSSSVNKNSFAASGGRKPWAFKEFVPHLEEEVNSDEVNESYVTVEARDKLHLSKVDIKLSFQENNNCDDTRLTIPPTSKENRSQGILAEGDESKLTGNLQAPPSHPRPVPVHVVEASMEIDTPHVTPHMEPHESIIHPSGGAPPEPFMDHSSSVNLHMAYHETVIHAPDGANLEPLVDHSSSVNSEHHTSTSNITFNQPFPGLHPILTPTQKHDDYQSFIHASSTFSNLLVSTLLQNPAAHAAASFAASFWPCANMEVPDCNTGGFPVGSINQAPSMAAIAAATVASATAWWAAHGLLPLCPPFQMGLSYAPSTAYPVPMGGVIPARAHDDERRKEANDPSTEPQKIEPKSSEALQRQHLTLKSPALASSALTVTETEQGGVDTELDTNKPKGRKDLGSSCGSNTPSSSEVDTDGMEKQKENKEELGVDSDAIGRRARNSICSSDSWKEVSEEGRMAFQALFSRVVLPQSFSPTNDSNTKDDEASKFDLNGNIWFNCSPNQQMKENAYSRGESSVKEDGQLVAGKLKGRRTGFKPYKRCSMDAKEGRGACANSSQDHEKCPKRVRLEGEALP